MLLSHLVFGAYERNGQHIKLAVQRLGSLVLMHARTRTHVHAHMRVRKEACTLVVVPARTGMWAHGTSRHIHSTCS